MDTSEGSGIVHRMKVRFADMLHEAEEWRHRRHELEPEPTGIFARMRRRIMSFVVERIAEQRLLWHMRKATEICARIPADMARGGRRARDPRDAEEGRRPPPQVDADRPRAAPAVGAADRAARARTCRGSISRSSVSATSCRCAARSTACRRVQWTFKPSEDLSGAARGDAARRAAAAASRARARAPSASRASGDVLRGRGRVDRVIFSPL